jgi:hypothetical protein
VADSLGGLNEVPPCVDQWCVSSATGFSAQSWSTSGHRIICAQPADVLAVAATAPLPTYDIYDRIPKVELRCHVEGTLRPGTVAELARKAGRPLLVDEPSQLYRYPHWTIS